MSNEDPNDTPRWRNKLDDLEYLPGSPFNRDAAWDKLYGRFQGNKKSKKIFWPWIAAACLLFGLMITILNYKKTAPQASTKETAMKQAKEIKKPVLKVEEVNKNEVENNVELIKNKIVARSGKPIQRNRHIIHTDIVTKVQPGNVVINSPEKEPLVKPLQIIHTSSTAAILPPKKKLNVVHINELGDPIIQPSDVTRIEDIHPFKLKFASGEVLSNSPIASKPPGLIILKTKPSSN